MKRNRLLLAGLLISAHAAWGDYAATFAALPADARNPGERCEFLGDPHPLQVEYGGRYSWAVPTAEAIAAIAAYNVPVVDFGAGAGYWSMLLAEAGVDVVAYDDWSWGRPLKLWHPVETGGVESLDGHSDRAMLLVYPPNDSPMAIDALITWGGDLLFFVGEPYRVTATPAFFDALAAGWHLERRVDLPNWRGKLDELYVLRRGAPDPGWINDALGRCGVRVAWQ